MRAAIFKEFAQSVSPEILKTYLDTILDSVVITDGIPFFLKCVWNTQRLCGI